MAQKAGFLLIFSFSSSASSQVVLLFSFTYERVCQDQGSGQDRFKENKIEKFTPFPSRLACSVAYGPEGDRCRVVDLDDPDLHDLLRLAGEDTNAEGLGGRPVLSGGETEWSDYDDDEDDDSDDGKFNYDSDSTAEEEAAAGVIDAVADAELDDAEDSRRLDAVLGGVNGSDGDTSPVRKGLFRVILYYCELHND
jgi:hypothetical protein